MAQHRIVPLYALFRSYTVRKSSNGGDYYIFDVLDSRDVKTVCRMDSIHASQVEYILRSLDKGVPLAVPVFTDNQGFYRIDLMAIKQEKLPVLSVADDKSARSNVEPKRGMPPVKVYTAEDQKQVISAVATKEKKPVVQSEKVKNQAPPDKFKRAQFTVTEEEYEKIKSIAEAEGYNTYSDWIRALVYRVINLSK